MQKSKKTFWAISKEYEEYFRTAAQESTNLKRKEKLQEDWQFLENVKSQVSLDQLGQWT